MHGINVYILLNLYLALFNKFAKHGVRNKFEIYVKLTNFKRISEVYNAIKTKNHF